MSEDTDYGFAVGRVRALETTLLDRARYDRLARARGAEEVKAALVDTSYGRYLTEESGRGDLTVVLQQVAADNFSFLTEYTIDPWVLEVFRLRADVHNLKLHIKAALVDVGVERSHLLGFGLLDDESLTALATTKSKAEPAWMRDAVVAAAEHYAESDDPGEVDLSLDRALHTRLVELSRPGAFMTGYLLLQADVENLRALVRVRVLGEDKAVLASALLPGGEVPHDLLLKLVDEDDDTVTARFRLSRFSRLMDEGVTQVAGRRSMLRFERLGREQLLQYLLGARYRTFGYEPLVSYYLFRENELTNLRQIFAAKTAGLDDNECLELIAHVGQ